MEVQPVGHQRPDGQRTFGRRIANLRAERGLTQKELAAVVGRSANWLSQVERGVLPVNRLDVLGLLADGLGVPPQTLQSDPPIPARPESRSGRASNDRTAVQEEPAAPGTGSAEHADHLLREIRLARQELRLAWTTLGRIEEQLDSLTNDSAGDR